MKFGRSVIFSLVALLSVFGFLLSAQQETIYLSLPSCIAALEEKPMEAERILAPYSHPRDLFLLEMERKIEQEIRRSGDPMTEHVLKLRKQQLLAAKTILLYARANTDPAIRKTLLRLNGLTDTLPARADDNIFDCLQPAIWKGDKSLKRSALKNRPELQIRKAAAVPLLIAIQFDMANALFDRVSDDPERRIAPLVELLTVASEPFPVPDGDTRKNGTSAESVPDPILIQTDFPVLDFYLNIFHLR